MDPAQLPMHRSTPGSGLRFEPQDEVIPGSFDGLIADAAEVTRHLAEVPRQRVITIPERAAAIVAGLGSYGD